MRSSAAWSPPEALVPAGSRFTTCASASSQLLVDPTRAPARASHQESGRIEIRRTAPDPTIDHDERKQPDAPDHLVSLVRRSGPRGRELLRLDLPELEDLEDRAIRR